MDEELIECLTEAMAGNHAGLVTESADVLYHLLVTWVDAGICPGELWAELIRREEVSHLTEEVPTKASIGGGYDENPVELFSIMRNSAAL
jgi:phosphoribosyl-ATP pyrophosphohydrolase